MLTNLHQIPAPSTFEGRESELAALTDWARSDLASASIIGAPGIGKTSLLRTFGDWCVSDGDSPFDAVYWCDVGSVRSFESLVAQIGRATGIPVTDTGDVHAAAERVIAALETRDRVLLLLDGTDRIVVQTRDVLPMSIFDARRIRWVLTSRVTTGIADRRIYLPPLAPQPALRVLVDSATRAGARALGDEVELAALAEQLGRSPLALELGGKWLVTLTAEQLITALAKHDTFLSDDEGAGGLMAALHETWQRATEADRASALALAALDTDFTVDLAAALWTMPVPAAARQLRRLQWLSFLWPSSEVPQRRFSLFLAVRTFLRQRAPARTLYVARERGARWLAERFESWDLVGRRAESMSLQAAFDWAIQADIALAARLALASLSMAIDGDAFAERLDHLTRALERLAEGPEPDVAVVSRLYFAIGRGHLLARDAWGAREALERARDLLGAPDGGEDDALRAQIRSALAQTLLLSAQLDEAAEVAARARALADEAGDVATQVEAHGVLAFIHTERLDQAAAEVAFLQMRKDSEWRGRAADMVLADAAALRIVALTGAIEMVVDRPREGASPRQVAEYWHRRGETLLALGRLDEARAAFEALLEDSGLRHDTRLVRVVASGIAAAHAVSDGGDVDPRPLAELTHYYEAGGWSYLETRSRLYWGVVLALAGQRSAAGRQLERALAQAEAACMTAHLRAFRGIAALVLGESDFMGAAGAGSPGPAWLVHTDALTRAALREEPPPPPAPHERWTQRAIRRLVADRSRSAPDPGAQAPAASEDVERSPAVLEIGPSWRWFRVGAGSKISLARRNAGRRILRRLVAIHRDAPEVTVTRDELREAGWPGEKMLPESAAARLHTTLWRLRTLGLAEVLETAPDGYRLRSELSIVEHDMMSG